MNPSDPSSLSYQFLIAGAFIFLGLLGIRALLRKTIPKQTLPEVDRRWVSAAGVGVLIFLGVSLSGLLVKGEPDPHKNSVPFIQAILFQYGFFLGLAFLAWHFTRPRPFFSTLGFAFPGWKAIGGAAGLYFCFLPLYLLATFLWDLLLKALELKLPPQDILQRVLHFPPLEFSVAFFSIIFVGPFFEEFFFRAYFQPVFRGFGNRMLPDPASKWIGVFLGGLVFGLSHDPIAWGPIFALGCFLAFLYDYSRSLWVTLTVHALHNALTLSVWILVPSVRDKLGG